jgi:osmotically-inducible protein OsmY
LPVTTPDAREDERIAREVRQRLNALGPEAVGIAIEITGGTVTLRGAVSSVMAAWRVEAAVRAVAGVTGIRNELRARETPSGY